MESVDLTVAAEKKTESAREQQLRELRAARAAIEEQIEAKAGDAELERETRALEDAKALSAAIDQHGPLDRELATVDTDFGMVIVKRVSAMRFKKFMDQKEYKSDHLEVFVRPTIVHPNKALFDEWCEVQPAILIRCSDAIARLAGIRKSEVEKK